jgi:phosphoglycerol transferase MdoB-like AlkP superfamily enzyme
MSDVSQSNGNRIKSRAHYAAPSTGVWARIGLLFGALCLIKILLLLTYRRYLFEIHWRISSSASGYVGEAAFYLFALLVGLNLWALGGRCAAVGMRATRTVNFCVLGLGAAFIFLTFHAGDKNYLFPLMNGILTWKNIGWYLAMNFCFGPPYLAAWTLVYALGYYVLGRTGREHWMLRVTAICAAVYTVFCLRDLMADRNALIAIDCLGIASLVASLAAGQRALRLLWICLPLLGMGFLYVLFVPFDNVLRKPDPEFVLLSAGSIILFTGATLLAWRSGGYAAWSWGLPFAFSSFLILINSNYILASNFNNLLTLGLTLPHYFLGEFAVASLLFALAFCYRLLLPKDSLRWLDTINLILIALALADLQLSRIMGVRLDWQLLEFGNSPTMMWRLARPYLPALLGMLAVLIAVYVMALLMIQKWCGRIIETEKAPARNGGLFALIAFLLLGFAGWGFANRDKVEGQTTIQLVDTNPLWRKTVEPPMSHEQFMATTRQFGVPLLATSGPPLGSESAPRDLNVVLIFQESSYNKYLPLFDGTNDTEPLLSRYKNRMELFPNFFSDFAGSIWARFATLTGLYPVQDFRKFTDQHVPVKSLFEILHDHHYSCSVFDSCFLDYTDFRDFLKGRDLDAVYDADTMPGPRKFPPVDWGLREEETLAAMQEQIKKYAAQKQKFFLTYTPVAPHNPFDGLSDRFHQRHMGPMGDFTPAYLNSLNYMDWIISSLIGQLKASGLLDKTLIVITDDHGEMLGQNGGPIGHGWTVTPELVNIPLIIMDPAKRGYTINDTVGSQVDLLPTILDRLNIPLPGGQIYEGTSLRSANPDTTRFIYLNSFQQYGVIQDHQLICGSRENEGAKNPGVSYVISNQGARTIFTQTDTPDFPLPSISQFDEFQKNFLANYAYYCRLLQ